MDSLRTFHADLTVLWDQWVIQVAEADGVHAIVLDLDDAEDTARDAIATVLGVDRDSFRVEIAGP